MHKKFEINRTKINGGCQSGRKVVTHNSKRIKIGFLCTKKEKNIQKRNPDETIRKYYINTFSGGCS